MKNENLQRLQEAELAYKRWKCPNFPDKYRKVEKYHEKNSNGIQNCIIFWCKYNKIYCIRLNTMGVWNKNTESYRTSGSTKGVSDLQVIVPNYPPIFIEVKYGKDKQRESQINFENKVKQSGGCYFVVRSFDDFMNLWDEILMKKS